MNIKGMEWKVSDRSIERLGVDIILIKDDNGREVKNVRCDGNATGAMLAGVIQTVHAVNAVLGYTDEFWERPGFHDVPKRKKK